MNWITDYVRPKFGGMFNKRDTPENLWTKCDECGSMLFHRELKDNLNTCPNCGNHMYISPKDRLSSLFDGGVYVEVNVPKPLADPLKFRDQKKYTDRLKDARKSTGEEDAMMVAEGEIEKLPVVVAVQDFAFMAGSMGMYVGNAIIAAAERAVEKKAPLILSSGCRMRPFG